MYHKSINPLANQSRAEQKLAALQVREADLVARINMLNTEIGVEQELRQKFGYVKEGEEVVVIVDPELEGVLYEDPGPEKSWWGTFKDMFGF